MVDGAFPKEARAAFHGFADNPGKRTGRASGDVVSGSEDGDGGYPERRGNVHAPGIIGEIDLARGGQFDKFAELGFPREVVGGLSGSSKLLGNFFAESPFVRGSE